MDVVKFATNLDCYNRQINDLHSRINGKNILRQDSSTIIYLFKKNIYVQLETLMKLDPEALYFDKLQEMSQQLKDISLAKVKYYQTSTFGVLSKLFSMIRNLFKIHVLKNSGDLGFQLASNMLINLEKCREEFKKKNQSPHRYVSLSGKKNCKISPLKECNPHIPKEVKLQGLINTQEDKLQHVHTVITTEKPPIEISRQLIPSHLEISSNASVIFKTTPSQVSTEGAALNSVESNRVDSPLYFTDRITVPSKKSQSPQAEPKELSPHEKMNAMIYEEIGGAIAEFWKIAVGSSTILAWDDLGDNQFKVELNQDRVGSHAGGKITISKVVYVTFNIDCETGEQIIIYGDSKGKGNRGISAKVFGGALSPEIFLHQVKFNKNGVKFEATYTSGAVLSALSWFSSSKEPSWIDQSLQKTHQKDKVMGYFKAMRWD